MSTFEDADAALLPGFERYFVDSDDGPVRVVSAGQGPALLMLHGDPQTHLCWHRIAPRLADRFTVILTDIRGRGETHKPGVTTNGSAYSKRASAAEQVAVMKKMGHDRFSLVGHDRGARVARRMALDHPDAIEQLVVMDIVPELDFYDGTNGEIAQDYFYFSFLTQPHPVPERLIMGDPKGFLTLILQGLSDRPVAYAEPAMRAYLEANATEEAIVAMCECFRAGYHIDQQHDLQDRSVDRRITCPTLVMWGQKGVIGRHFDVPAVWRSWCTHSQFEQMPSGHFIPEEAPDEVFAALEVFLAGRLPS